MSSPASSRSRPTCDRSAEGVPAPRTDSEELQDTLTKGEHSLARDGKADLVLSTCHAYQQTMRTELVAAIEQLTGRQAIASLSDSYGSTRLMSRLSSSAGAPVSR